MKLFRQKLRTSFVALLSSAALFGLVSQSALAAGTASGTSISNQATVNYTVGATAQPAVTSTAATFLVDNKVDMTLTSTGATVVPGSTKQALAFVLTNTGNTSQRYALSAVAGASTLTTALTNVAIYLDNGTTPGVWDAGDTLYADASTFGDVAAGNALNVLIVADFPAPDTNGQTAAYNLQATTVNAGTTTVTSATGAVPDNPAAVDVVFADAAGTVAGDIASDGKLSASATYTVNAASVTISKNAVVYSDPVNGVSANAKAIPGAVITYTITVSNAAGGADATSVAITDSLAAEIAAGHLAFNTQFGDAANTCAAAQGIVVNGTCNTNASGDDNGDWNATTANTVTVSGLTVTAGSSATIKFQATVQ